jgi:hypothetical protein
MRVLGILAVLVGASLPAQADWQFTHWGMTPEQFAKTAGPKAIRVKEKSGIAFEMPYTSDFFQFDAKFLFRKSGLAVVDLKLKRGNPGDLHKMLVEKYGRSKQEKYGLQRGLFGSVNYDWETPEEKVSLLDWSQSRQGVELIYERRGDSGL